MPHTQLLARCRLLLFALIVASNCSRDTVRPEPPAAKPTRAVISSPILPAAGSSSSRTLGSASAAQMTDSVVYLSMQPGIVSRGASVAVRNSDAPNSTSTASMIDGGFDPVAIHAVAGDSLIVVTRDSNGVTREEFGIVSPRQPPRVVRTVPSQQGMDLAVDAGVVIVFTEPMDSASVVNGVILQEDGEVVPTTVALAPSGPTAIQATLQPVSELEKGKTYELVISTAVRNLVGESLLVAVDRSFTTEPGLTNPFGDLAIDSFAMIEFQVNHAGQYYYAPQLVVSEPTGSATLRITGFVLVSMTTFPINMNSDMCSTNIVVGPGQTKQLFAESYGDYPLYYWWPGHRPSRGSAFVRITYKRDGGEQHTVAIQGPMTPGELPTTYSGGDGNWFLCAQGPPG